MKKSKIYLIPSLFLILNIQATSPVAAESKKGLYIENEQLTWISPTNGKKYILQNASSACTTLRKNALRVTEKSLQTIPGPTQEKPKKISSYIGRFLYTKGKDTRIWYVDPKDGRRHWFDCSEKSYQYLKNTLPTKPAATNPEIAENCKNFADRLKTCTPFICTFEHPFTGDPMKKHIIGLKNGVCQYEEEMPNNGKLSCAYQEKTRQSIADFVQQLDNGTKLTTKTSFDENGSKTITYLNEIPVENPTEKALDTKECVISGY